MYSIKKSLRNAEFGGHRNDFSVAWCFLFLCVKREDIKMTYYEIIANHFAPKRKDLLTEEYSASHSICYNRCNFNCCFCDFRDRPVDAYHRFEEDDFINGVEKLLPLGTNFKFTGGEPTLNPEIESHLSIVKKHGGYIYFDSNGSNPDVLAHLMEKGLIDVLGISLKGITAEEAIATVGIKSVKLSWENVWKSIEIASKYSAIVRTIVTLVFTEENRTLRLQMYANLLSKYSDVYMKINNLQNNGHTIQAGMRSVDQSSLLTEISEFVQENPAWKGRVIYVPDQTGVSDYHSIQFF